MNFITAWLMARKLHRAGFPSEISRSYGDREWSVAAADENDTWWAMPTPGDVQKFLGE